MKQEVEPDDFLEGLSLGIWDEEFEYYRTAGEIAMQNVIYVEFGEPEITSTDDFRSGEW